MLLLVMYKKLFCTEPTYSKVVYGAIDSVVMSAFSHRMGVKLKLVSLKTCLLPKNWNWKQLSVLRMGTCSEPLSC